MIIILTTPASDISSHVVMSMTDIVISQTFNPKFETREVREACKLSYKLTEIGPKLMKSL